METTFDSTLFEIEHSESYRKALEHIVSSLQNEGVQLCYGNNEDVIFVQPIENILND